MKTSGIQALSAACCVVLAGVSGACGGDEGMMMGALTGGASGGVAAGSGPAGSTAAGASGSPMMPTGPAGSGAAGMATGTAGRGMATAGSPGAAGRAGSTAGMSGGTAGSAGMAGMAGMMAATAGGGAGSAGRAGMGGMTAAGSGGMAGAAGGGTGTAATFTEVYGLIMAGCSCHVTGSSGGLSMANKMTAYTNLVGANASACAGEKRVVAGDPAKSVLYHSLDRTTFGTCKAPQMPAGGAKWSAANLDKLKSWIMAGAMNN